MFVYEQTDIPMGKKLQFELELLDLTYCAGRGQAQRFSAH
jgi:hypothetical protein